MEYNKYNMKISTDYPLRVINEDENDTDIIINIDNRTLNFTLQNPPKFLNSRLQFCDIKNIIIRFSSIEPNICTVHFLRNIDLHSSVVNFEIDYSNSCINIIDKEFFVEFKIINK